MEYAAWAFVVGAIVGYAVGCWDRRRDMLPFRHEAQRRLEAQRRRYP